MSVEQPIEPAQEAISRQIAAPQAANPPRRMQLAGTNIMHTINARRYPLRNPQRTPKYQLTYCQVVIPITFQDNNTTFYLTASCVVGAGPCTLSSVGDNQATPELNETAKDTPKSATPTALEFKNFSLNLTLTTGLGVQELTVKTDSDITPAGSFGVNDNDLTYLGLIEDSPEIKNTNSDLSALIKETGNIH